jgi:hypothetical protein
MLAKNDENSTPGTIVNANTNAFTRRLALRIL